VCGGVSDLRVLCSLWLLGFTSPLSNYLSLYFCFHFVVVVSCLLVIVGWCYCKIIVHHINLVLFLFWCGYTCYYLSIVEAFSDFLLILLLSFLAETWFLGLSVCVCFVMFLGDILCLLGVLRYHLVS